MDNFDIVIVGGGLVGTALALALAGSGRRLALVEARSEPLRLGNPAEERHFALAEASIHALTGLGVWSRLTPARPIARIHVSSRGQFGRALLCAADEGRAAFGATVPASELGRALAAALAEQTELTRLQPARVVAMEQGNDALTLTLDEPAGERRISGRLVVAADGTDSALRDLAGIACQRLRYPTLALVSSVTSQRPLADTAYERFTESGPLALLPLGERRAGVVWTLPEADARQLAEAPGEDFLAALQEAFGLRLGRLSAAGARALWPLQRLAAERLFAGRLVLVGNAAQTVHPVAAQGFNLGLRDALTLAELSAHVDDPGDPRLLSQYAPLRGPDREAVLQLTDGLLRLFEQPLAPLRWLRSLALTTVGQVPALRTLVARHGMGYRGSTPALARRAEGVGEAARS